jgi:hypothetical protein
MVRSVKAWAKRHWLILAFVAANLGLAAPAAAGWDDAVCQSAEAIELCCTRCLIFCHCSL